MHAGASNEPRMGTGVAELAGVVFLVAFYVWLLIVLITSVCKWIVSSFGRLNSSLSDDAVRDRVAGTALGKVFLTAFWPFGDVQIPKATATDRDAAIVSASIAPARLLMDENRRLCEWKLASIRAIEQKAIGQATAAAIIFAVLAAFSRDDLSFAYRAIPIASLVVAIAAYIKTAYIRAGGLPSFGPYLATDVIAEPNEGRLAILAGNAWYAYGLELDAVSKIKGRYVKTGNFWLIAALLVILLLAVLPAAPSTTSHPVCCPPASIPGAQRSI